MLHSKKLRALLACIKLYNTDLVFSFADSRGMMRTIIFLCTSKEIATENIETRRFDSITDLVFFEKLYKLEFLLQIKGGELGQVQ